MRKNNWQALGRLKVGQMNKTETAYSKRLEEQKQAGEILWWKFEGLKFRLADNTFYTPDFAVMTSAMQLEAHEVKGFWQDDARVKIKVASEMYPIQFRAVKAKSGSWEAEEF